MQTNPKTPGSFNNYFLNEILFGCITDTQFLRQIRSSFPLEMFRSPIRIKIASLLYDFIDQYKESPGNEFYNLFDNFIDTVPEKQRELYFKLIEVVKEIESINKEYILDNIFRAIRHLRLEEAIVECARLVKMKKYDDAERTFFTAIKDPTKLNFQYFNYLDSFEDCLSRIDENPFVMKSLIPPMDAIIGGFRRGETIVWLGTPKSGKTYGLISMTHAALLQGLSVVFISLELHRYRISGRLDQTSGFLGGLKDIAQEVMEKRGDQWYKVKRTLNTIYDLKKVQKTRQTLQRYGGKLIIASAPGGTKNFQDIELFLDELEMSQGVVPDVVCVDYLRNMRGTATKQTRKEKVSENCLGLVKIASERRLVMHTAQQGNRAAMRAKLLTPDMIADDVDAIGYADIIPTICQTESEEQNNRARLYLAAVRESAKGALISIVRDLARGQFVLEAKLVAHDWDSKEKKKDKK